MKHIKRLVSILISFFLFWWDKVDDMDTLLYDMPGYIVIWHFIRQYFTVEVFPLTTKRGIFDDSPLGTFDKVKTDEKFDLNLRPGQNFTYMVKILRLHQEIFTKDMPLW